MTITTAQIRGARGILGWSQSDLSERTGISATSIGAIENGSSTPRESSLIKIRTALEAGGIEFMGLDGLRMKKNYIRTLSGAQGFNDFLDDVFATAIKYGTKEKPTEVWLSNVAHENWIRWMGPDKWKNHTDRMVAHKDIMDVKIITKEGDTSFPAQDYAQYKWSPENIFSDKSFYSYHDKLAFLNFKRNDVEITIIEQQEFAEGYRNLFQIAWDYVAKTPKPNQKVGEA